MKIGIIGGGAAGFMAATTAKEFNPEIEVTILEKTHKLLSKVKISGGGRCNVTNAIASPSLFAKNYPRGEKQLKKGFGQFSPTDTISWFENRGVKLKSEPDGRMFPVTDSSQTIVDCFIKEAKRKNIAIKTGFSVEKISLEAGGFRVSDKSEEIFFNKLLVASGGSAKASGFSWLTKTGHTIADPVPSLFTFNMPSESIKKLQGVAVPEAKVRIAGTKLSYQGPVLITHWGMSGPAVLKLSAWGARMLAGVDYKFPVSVSWINMAEEETKEVLQRATYEHPKKQMVNYNPFALPQRLWEFLLDRSGAGANKTWNECGKKNFNKLTEKLINDTYNVQGKTTFKEEFVTCGGINLNEVDFATMGSKMCPGLFFAGEVLDVDGITGGFNFQAAWTTGFIAGKSMAGR